jgi:hypothetical protein
MSAYAGGSTTGTYLSWPTVPDTVAAPRWRLLVNKKVFVGCTQLTVHTNNHYEPDTLSATLAFNADAGSLATWTDGSPPVLVEAQAGFLTAGSAEGSLTWTSIFLGELDSPSVSLVDGTVQIECRDLSRRLVDYKTRQTWPNLSVSQLVTKLAGLVNLTADVDSFPQNVGTYYQIEHDKVTADSMSHTQTLRDVVFFLARQVGADYWVSGQTLHFKASVYADTATPYSLVYTPSGATSWPSIPVIDLSLKRDLTLAKDVVVTMRIWDSKGKKAQQISYPSASASAISSGTAQQYVLPPRPGLSPAAALLYLQAQYQDITQHERLLTVEIPGELNMTARSIIALSGTNTSFDQRYYVDSIDRTWSLDQGFTQSLSLKNHSTVSEEADL